MGNTECFFEAYDNGDFLKVKDLIENGADIELKRDFGYTLLSVASQRGKNDNIVFLLERGADMENKDNNGQSPLVGPLIMEEMTLLGFY
jgi:serine/threonine-protein phosphatase 6 regulatory ankyrin repeat subunit B